MKTSLHSIIPVLLKYISIEADIVYYYYVYVIMMEIQISSIVCKYLDHVRVMSGVHSGIYH